jgi:hypothetical protein
MDVNWLAKRLDDRPQLQCKCQGMGRLIDSAVDNLGRIITDLRPSILDHQGLWAALEWQAQEFFAHTADGHADLQPDLQITVAAGVPPPEGGQAIAIFRIFQEMLSNVARHARARHVQVRLWVDDPPEPVLYLSVRDDGVGAPAQALEDAAVLADCLQGATADSAAGALLRYDALRRPRASQVQLMSRGRELRNHLPDGPEQQSRDSAFEKGDPLRDSAWLYGHDVRAPAAAPAPPR